MNTSQAPLLSDRFVQAFAYACEAHQKQVRKSTGIPYVAHLMAVTAIALEHGATETEAMAALLHDAAEDAGGQARLEDIQRRFGPEVAAIVDGCTDTYEAVKPPWKQRKEAYLRHLATASPSVRLVSASDKLHNARSILAEFRREGNALWSRFNGGREGTLWYYRAVTNVLQSHGSSPLLDELNRTVTELERLAGI